MSPGVNGSVADHDRPLAMNVSNALAISDDATDLRGQFGALCWRMHRGQVEVLLITSRDTGRWVIPKGWPVEGLGPMGSAQREAWEEAGVEGEAGNGAIGQYCYDKTMAPDPALPCRVTVFPLRVARLKDRFPERNLRRRKWFDAAKAARMVIEPELRALLVAVAANPGLLAPETDRGDAVATA